MKSTLKTLKKKFNIKQKKGTYNAEHFKHREDKKIEKNLRMSQSLSLSISNLTEDKIFEDKSKTDDNDYLEPIKVERSNDNLPIDVQTNVGSVQIVKPKLKLDDYHVGFNSDDYYDGFDSSVAFSSNDDSESYKSCMSDEEYIEMPQIVNKKKNSFITTTRANYNSNLNNLISEIEVNGKFQKQSDRNDSSSVNEEIEDSVPSNYWTGSRENKVELNLGDKNAKIYEDCEYADVDYLQEKVAIEKDLIGTVSTMPLEYSDVVHDDLDEFANELGENEDDFYSDEESSNINRFNGYLLKRGMSVSNDVYSLVDYASKKENSNSKEVEEIYYDKPCRTDDDEDEVNDLIDSPNQTIVRPNGKISRWESNKKLTLEEIVEGNVQESRLNDREESIYDNVEEKNIALKTVSVSSRDDEDEYVDINTEGEYLTKNEIDYIEKRYEEFNDEYEKIYETVHFKNQQPIYNNVPNYTIDKQTKDVDFIPNSITTIEEEDRLDEYEEENEKYLEKKDNEKYAEKQDDKHTKRQEEKVIEEDTEKHAEEQKQNVKCEEKQEERHIIPNISLEDGPEYANLHFEVNESDKRTTVKEQEDEYANWPYNTSKVEKVEVTHEMIKTNLRKHLVNDEQKSAIYEELLMIKNEINIIELSIKESTDDNKHRHLASLFKKLRNLTGFNLRNTDEDLLDIQRDILLQIQNCIKQLNN